MLVIFARIRLFCQQCHTIQYEESKCGGVAARFGDYLCVDSANFARCRWLYAHYKQKKSPTLDPKFPSLAVSSK